MSGWEEAGGDGGRASRPLDSGELRSIGSYLAAQRDLRGISIEELAQLTRIPLRSLARLESGSYDGVTDGFVRGFVRTVAESLGLEPDDTVARMLREPTQDDEVGMPPSPLLRRLVLLGVALLAIAAALGVARAFWVAGDAPDLREVEHVFRRDAVRVLAESQRAAMHRAATGAAPAPVELLATSEGAPEAADASPLATSEGVPEAQDASALMAPSAPEQESPVAEAPAPVRAARGVASAEAPSAPSPAAPSE